MVAAKEKTLSLKVDPIVNRMDNKSALPTATKEPSTVVNRISSYDFRTRKFSKLPIGTSEKIHLIVAVENQHWPREYIGENVVRLRRLHRAPGMSLYRAYFVPGGMDPEGTDVYYPVDFVGPLPGGGYRGKRVCKCRTKSWAAGPHGGPTGDETTYEYTAGSCSALNGSNINGSNGWNKTCKEVTNPAPETFAQCMAKCKSKLSNFTKNICKNKCKHRYRNRLNMCPSKKPTAGVPDSKGNIWTADGSAGQIYHPGLECFRSGDYQCCYDCDGDVVTRGPNQGTYDYAPPSNWHDHGLLDMYPHHGDKNYYDDLTPVY